MPAGRRLDSSDDVTTMLGCQRHDTDDISVTPRRCFLLKPLTGGDMAALESEEIVGRSRVASDEAPWCAPLFGPRVAGLAGLAGSLTLELSNTG